MPQESKSYHIVKRGNQFCVEDSTTGKNHGCHPTEAAAKRQMRAIGMHSGKALDETEKKKRGGQSAFQACISREIKRCIAAGKPQRQAIAIAYSKCSGGGKKKAIEEKTIVRYTQDEAGFVPLSMNSEQACANCRWFAGAVEGGPYCNIIENYPLHIEANSYCDEWDALPVDAKEPRPIPVEIMPDGEAARALEDDLVIADYGNGQFEVTTPDGEQFSIDFNTLNEEARASDECDTCGDSPANLSTLDMSQDANDVLWEPSEDLLEGVVEDQGNELEPVKHTHPAAKTIYAAPDSNQPGILKAIAGRLKHGLKPGHSLIKGADGKRLMLLVTSNSYQDREAETLTSDALKEDVDRHWTQGDDAYMSNNPLLFWHDDDLRLGDVIWGDMIGPFYVEVAREADNPVAKQYFDYREQHPEEKWGASHRFAYFTQHRTDAGDYRRIFKKETSSLPLEAAANLITYSGVVPMSDKRAKKFDEIFGFDGAYNLIKTEGLAALEARLREQGIDHKSVDKTDSESPADTGAVALLGKAFVDLADDQDALLKELDDAKAELKAATEAANAKATALDAALTEIKAMQEKLQAQLDHRPRSASRATETEIENADLAKEVRDALLVDDPVFGKVLPPK